MRKGCSSLWCRSKCRWCTGRKGKEERGRKHTQKEESVSVCIVTDRVKSAQRKGSDQRREETMEEARGRQGRVGGTVKTTKPLCTLQHYCFMNYLYGNVFLSWSLPPFFLPGSCTHPTTHPTVTTFYDSLASAGQRKHHSHKRCGRTVPHSNALFYWHIHTQTTIAKRPSDVADTVSLPPYDLICQAWLTNEWTPAEVEMRQQQEIVNTCGSCGSKGSYLHNASLITDLLALLSVGMGEIRERQREVTSARLWFSL